MLTNIIGVLIGGFVLWGLEHDGHLETLLHKKIKDYAFNDVLLIMIAVGATAILIRSFFGLF